MSSQFDIVPPSVLRCSDANYSRVLPHNFLFLLFPDTFAQLRNVCGQQWQVTDVVKHNALPPAVSCP